ncbi:class II aldolase/adducin family protein [Streptomyces sp. SID5785]|uniref:class II aldolase/adducin family protein n=1 Tax=Streptomyces sp. SID5785 TaxID=2690309 RepID=UPI001361567A|nr:class II aldolase/adducin family protein [Streptomyces sp. SID5785]MZD09722.1 class II aldolase/adducin family protein [Streptomyces sp. SID5785]
MSTQIPAPVPTDQLLFAMPPVHTDPADERRYRKERLAGALRTFGRLGYEDGVSGHITARDPEFEDCYWVNPFGMPLRHVTVGDLVLADGDGQVREGRHHVNQAAFTVHAEVHRARPDLVAVAHCHSTYGRALAALGELIEPITQEACAFYEDHALLDEYTGVSVDAGEGKRIAVALGAFKALILRNHGLLTVGDSVDAAAWWFIALERCAEVQLAARAAGRPVLIDRRQAVETREKTGGDLVAWINYQSLWQDITRSEPEFLA